MGKRDEVNERAMQAMTLRRQGMAVKEIALYLGVHLRYAYTLLDRAKKLWVLVMESSDSQQKIAENLAAFEEMERIALQNLARVSPGSSIAVAYLNAARDAREKIKKLQQESGLIVQVPTRINITDADYSKEPVRMATLKYLEELNEIERVAEKDEKINKDNIF